MISLKNSWFVNKVFERNVDLGVNGGYWGVAWAAEEGNDLAKRNLVSLAAYFDYVSNIPAL